MRLLSALLAVAVGVCHAHPGDVRADYVYPSYLPQHPGDLDLAHRFGYKEYFPTPSEVGVGSAQVGGKLYSAGHAFPSFDERVVGKAQYITSGSGQQLGEKAQAFSGHIGGKVTYLTSGISGQQKGYYDDKNGFADDFGFYGREGYGRSAGIPQGVRLGSFGGTVAAIKHAEVDIGDAIGSTAHNVKEGISDAIGNTAQSVKEGISAGLNTASQAIKEVQYDLTDHLSRSAVHVQKGISGTISDTTYTAKTLFGILSEYLGRKVAIIREGAGHQFQNTKDALTATSAALFRHIGKKALGVGEFFQNKAHEVNVSIQKKVNRGRAHAPSKLIEPLNVEIPAYTGKLVGPGAALGSGYGAGSDVGGARGGGGFGGYLFQPTKVPDFPVPPLLAQPQYEESSYTKI